MSKLAFAIPSAIAVIAVIVVLTVFGDLLPQKNTDFTLADFIERGSPHIGTSSAPITIVEFGDYQCTFCYKFHKNSLDVIKKEYIDTGKASMIFLDFPLNGLDSVLAAEASHCANDQGKFWAMHNEIYKNWNGERTGWVNRASLISFGQTAGLDIAALEKCLDSKKYEKKVLDTYEFGQGIKIDATPSFLIISGDKITKITGNQPLEVFRKVLND